MDRKFNNPTMLIACKEITKNPDNLVKIFSYFGYLRENEGEGGGGGVVALWFQLQAS